MFAQIVLYYGYRVMFHINDINLCFYRCVGSTYKISLSVVILDKAIM